MCHLAVTPVGGLPRRSSISSSPTQWGTWQSAPHGTDEKFRCKWTSGKVGHTHGYICMLQTNWNLIMRLYFFYVAAVFSRNNCLVTHLMFHVHVSSILYYSSIYKLQVAASLLQSWNLCVIWLFISMAYYIITHNIKKKNRSRILWICISVLYLEQKISSSLQGMDGCSQPSDNSS